MFAINKSIKTCLTSNMSVDFDVKGQQGMDLFTGRSVIIRAVNRLKKLIAINHMIDMS